MRTLLTLTYLPKPPKSPATGATSGIGPVCFSVELRFCFVPFFSPSPGELANQDQEPSWKGRVNPNGAKRFAERVRGFVGQRAKDYEMFRADKSVHVAVVDESGLTSWIHLSYPGHTVFPHHGNPL